MKRGKLRDDNPEKGTRKKYKIQKDEHVRNEKIGANSIKQKCIRILLHASI